MLQGRQMALIPRQSPGFGLLYIYWHWRQKEWRHLSNFYHRQYARAALSVLKNPCRAD